MAYTVGLEADGSDIVATAQVYGGKLLAEVALSGEPGICTVVAGSFPAGLEPAPAARRSRRSRLPPGSTT